MTGGFPASDLAVLGSSASRERGTICETFATPASADANLSPFVEDEFDAFRLGGIVLTHGFLRLRCVPCGHEKLPAFNCNTLLLCSSCGARHMAQTAAQLVNHVIPHRPSAIGAKVMKPTNMTSSFSKCEKTRRKAKRRFEQGRCQQP